MRLSKTTTSPGGVPGPAPIHIGLERLRVGRPGENQRRPYPIQAQGSDHGRRTPRGGHRALGPLTPPCPGVGRRHRRVDPRLVDEDQPFCLDSPHLRPVSPPLGLHLGSVPLAGMQGLLLVGQAEAAEGAPEGRQGAGEAAPLLQLVQGGIGMLGDQHRQSYLFGETEDRPRPAAVGLGGQGAGVPTPLEESGDERDTDAEISWRCARSRETASAPALNPRDPPLGRRNWWRDGHQVSTTVGRCSTTGSSFGPQLRCLRWARLPTMPDVTARWIIGASQRDRHSTTVLPFLSARPVE